MLQSETSLTVPSAWIPAFAGMTVEEYEKKSSAKGDQVKVGRDLCFG